MSVLEIEKSRDNYNRTKKRLLSIVEETMAKAAVRRWCKGEYKTDIFPFRDWADVETYNDLQITFLEAPPGNVIGHSECGFDALGKLIVVRTYVKGGAQTKIVLERDDSHIASFYFFDTGDKTDAGDTLHYYEQHFDDGRATTGLIFDDIEDDRSYTICEYRYDNQEKLIGVEEYVERIRSTMPVEQQLARIEEKFEISLPPLFRQLYLSKLNEYGQSKKEWRDTLAQRAFSNPPALMCAVDVEWMTAEEIVDWEPEDYWNPDHKFVPFAGNGAGDLWCFYLNWASDSGIPVVLVSHDEDSTEAYAGDFETFLVRHLVESFSRFWDTMMKHRGCDSIAAYKRHLNANLETIAPLLPSWAPRLRKFLDVEPFSIGGDEYSLIPQDVKEEILRELSFEHEGASFEHVD